MSDARGGAWGTSWGVSWGSGAAAPALVGRSYPRHGITHDWRRRLKQEPATEQGETPDPDEALWAALREEDRLAREPQHARLTREEQDREDEEIVIALALHLLMEAPLEHDGLLN